MICSGGEETMMELLTKPAVGGIIEKNIDGLDYILIQDRCKKNSVVRKLLTTLFITFVF